MYRIVAIITASLATSGGQYNKYTTPFAFMTGIIGEITISLDLKGKSKRNYKLSQVCKRLLENLAIAEQKDIVEATPLVIAVRNELDTVTFALFSGEDADMNKSPV